MMALLLCILTNSLPLLNVATDATVPKQCSVTDWGAVPDDDSSDDAPSFRKALAACAGATVIVPAGKYRLDSTVDVGNTSLSPQRNRTCDGEICPWCHCPVPPITTQLHLNHGAVVRRLAMHSSAITPVLRLAQYGCMITGDGGAVESENASPRGVVNLGPTKMPPYTPCGDHCEHDPSRSTPGEHGALMLATISGLRITGQYRCTNKTMPGMGTCIPAKQFSRSIIKSPELAEPQTMNPPWTNTSDYEQCGMFPGQTASFGRDGSVGLCLDSAEPLDMGQSCAYQNTVKDLVITAVDVGLYASKWTNANNYHNLQFISDGSASIWFDHVDESTVFGGFTNDGFPGDPWPGNAAQHCDSVASCHNVSNPQAVCEYRPSGFLSCHRTNQPQNAV